MTFAFGSLFTGGGGADLGALAAGLSPVAGVEYDARIADVGRRNLGDHIQVARVEDVDYGAWPALFWLHASPSCKTASQANNDGGEGPADISAAAAVVAALEAIQPRRFSLENVWAYRTYASFANILAALHSQGYAVGFWHLNAADYGVPQTRKRLILVASLDHTPRRPLATHYNPRGGQASMLLAPWVGWYAAIADILHTLPASEFAPWQLERLPAALRTCVMRGDNSQQEGGNQVRWADTPIFTIGVSAGRSAPRALLVGGGNTNKTIIDSTYRDGIGPSYTVTAASMQDRAFLCDGQTNEGERITIRGQAEPCFTVGASSSRRPARPALAGRTVAMTVRALARFQSFPDAAHVTGVTVGNAVPPLLARRVLEANV